MVELRQPEEEQSPLRAMAPEVRTKKILQENIDNLIQILRTEKTVKIDPSLSNFLETFPGVHKKYPKEYFEAFEKGIIPHLRISDLDGILIDALNKRADKFAEIGIEVFYDESRREVYIINPNFKPTLVPELIQKAVEILEHAHSLTTSDIEKANILYESVLWFVRDYGQGAYYGVTLSKLKDSLKEIGKPKSKEEKDEIALLNLEINDYKKITGGFYSAASLRLTMGDLEARGKQYPSITKTVDALEEHCRGLAFTTEEKYAVQMTFERPPQKEIDEQEQKAEQRRRLIIVLNFFKRIDEMKASISKFQETGENHLSSKSKKIISEYLEETRKILKQGDVGKANKLYLDALHLTQFYLSKDNSIPGGLKSLPEATHDNLFDPVKLDVKKFYSAFGITLDMYNGKGLQASFSTLQSRAQVAFEQAEMQLLRRMELIKKGIEVPDIKSADTIWRRAVDLQSRAISVFILLDKMQNLNQLIENFQRFSKIAAFSNITQAGIANDFKTKEINEKLKSDLSLLRQNYLLYANSFLERKPIDRKAITEIAGLESRVSSAVYLLSKISAYSDEFSYVSTALKEHTGVTGKTALEYFSSRSKTLANGYSSLIYSAQMRIVGILDSKQTVDIKEVEKNVQALDEKYKENIKNYAQAAIRSLGEAATFEKIVKNERQKYTDTLLIVNDVLYDSYKGEYSKGYKLDRKYDELEIGYISKLYAGLTKQANATKGEYGFLFDQILAEYSPEGLFDKTKEGYVLSKTDLIHLPSGTMVYNSNVELIKRLEPLGSTILAIQSLIWPVYADDIQQRFAGARDYPLDSTPDIRPLEMEELEGDKGELIKFVTLTLIDLNLLKEQVKGIKDSETRRKLEQKISRRIGILEELVEFDLKNKNASLRLGTIWKKVLSAEVYDFGMTSGVGTSGLFYKTFRKQVLEDLKNEHMEEAIKEFEANKSTFDKIKEFSAKYTPVILIGSGIVGGVGGFLVGGPAGAAYGASGAIDIAGASLAVTGVVGAIHDSYLMFRAIDSGDIGEIDRRRGELMSDAFLMLPLRFRAGALAKTGSKGILVSLGKGELASLTKITSGVLLATSAVNLIGTTYSAIDREGTAGAFDIAESLAYFAIGAGGLTSARGFVPRLIPQATFAQRISARAMTAKDILLKASSSPAKLFTPAGIFGLSVLDIGLKSVFSPEYRKVLVRASKGETNAIGEIVGGWGEMTKGMVAFDYFVFGVSGGALKDYWKVRIARKLEGGGFSNLTPIDMFRYRFNVSMNLPELVKAVGSKINPTTGFIPYLERDLTELLMIASKEGRVSTRTVRDYLLKFKSVGADVGNSKIRSTTKLINEMAKETETTLKQIVPGKLLTSRLLKFTRNAALMILGGVENAHYAEEITPELGKLITAPLPAFAEADSLEEQKKKAAENSRRVNMDSRIKDFSEEAVNGKTGNSNGTLEKDSGKQTIIAKKNPLAYESETGQETTEQGDGIQSLRKELEEEITKAKQLLSETPELNSDAKAALGLMWVNLFPDIAEKFVEDKNSHELKDSMTAKESMIEFFKIISKDLGWQGFDPENASIGDFVKRIAQTSDSDIGKVLEKHGVQKDMVQSKISILRNILDVYLNG